MKPKNYSYKLIKNNKVKQYVRTHSKRRFCTRLASINWKHRPLKIYLRVSYGKALDNFGKVVTFYNDGWYSNKRDFDLAFTAFTEND